MADTQTNIHRRYNEKTYKRIYIQLPIDTVDKFKAKCERFGISQRSVILEAVEKFLNDPMDAKAECEREQGEWIFDPEMLCSDVGVYSAGYRCSVCGKDYFKVDRMNYCPHCGARMKGADDE